MSPVEAWLSDQRQRVRPALYLAVGLGISAGLLLIYQAYLLARLADAVIFRDAGLESLWPLLWGLLGIFFVRAALVFWTERAAFDAGAATKTRVRMRLFDKLQSLGPLRAGTEGAGEIAGELVEGVEALEAYYSNYLPDAALAAFLPFAVLLFVLPADWFSAVVFLFTAPLIPLFMILIGKGAEQLNQRQWNKLAHLGGRLLDSIQGLTTLKLFNAARREAEVIAKISDEYRRSTMAVLRVAFLSSMVLEFFTSVSIAVVAVFIGFRLLGYLEWGPIDFRTGFFVLLLAPEFYRPLRNLGARYHDRMEAIGAAAGLVRLLEQTAPECHRASRPVPIGPAFSIVFEDVSLNYPSGRTALRGLDLRVEPGERVALVGHSGAGKTSVFNLLLGFATPDSGSVRVNGTPIERIDLDLWRRQIAWVPQHSHIFHGTLRENILLGLTDTPNARIEQALEMAGADEFVRLLPEGLDTVVGERGQGLSGGQTRRIALARAFVRDAPLVLLDEATASLDQATEAVVSRAVERLARQRTVLVITHRLRTVRDADRIVVLEHGRVVEEGSHDSLLARGGLYSKLARRSSNLS